MIRLLSILLLTAAIAKAKPEIIDGCGSDKNGEHIREITYTEEVAGQAISVMLRQARYDFTRHYISGGATYEGDKRPADYKPATIDGVEIPGTDGKNPFLGDLGRYRSYPDEPWPARTIDTLRDVEVRWGGKKMTVPRKMHIHLLGLQLQTEYAGGKGYRFLPDAGGKKLLIQMIAIDAENPYLVSLILRRSGEHKVINHGDWKDEFPTEEKAWEMVRKVTNQAEDDAVDFVLEFGGAITRDEMAPGRPVVGVNLHDMRGLMDAHLKELAPFKNLTTLWLSECWELTDAGMKELTQFNRLTRLELGGTAVSDAGLKELSALKNLTKIGLTGTWVTDAGVKELGAFKHLTTLDIFNSELTDAGVKELATLKSLTTLGLYSPDITVAGLKELAALNALTTLTLFSRNLTDADAQELAVLKGLTKLNLFNSQVTDEGIKELKKALPKCHIRR